MAKICLTLWEVNTCTSLQYDYGAISVSNLGDFFFSILQLLLDFKMFAVDSESIRNNTDLVSVFGTDYGVLKGIMITITLLIIIMGVSGNIIVLIGSIKYKALKMDKVSVILLENVAVADLMMTIMFCIPMLITLIAEKWTLL